MRIEYREINGSAAKYAKVKSQVYAGYESKALGRFVIMDASFPLDGETEPSVSKSAVRTIDIAEYAAKKAVQIKAEADARKEVPGKIVAGKEIGR